MAFAGVTDGRPTFLMMGRDGIETRDLLTEAHRYRRIAMAHPPNCPCTEALVSYLRSLPEGSGTYSLLPVAATGLLGRVRFWSIRTSRQLWPLAVAFGVIAELRSRVTRGSYAHCASFAVRALEQTRCESHSLEVRRVEYCPSRRGASLADRLTTRWFVTPSELWNAAPVASRSELVSNGCFLPT